MLESQNEIEILEKLHLKSEYTNKDHFIHIDKFSGKNFTVLKDLGKMKDLKVDQYIREISTISFKNRNSNTQLENTMDLNFKFLKLITQKEQRLSVLEFFADRFKLINMREMPFIKILRDLNDKNISDFYSDTDEDLFAETPQKKDVINKVNEIDDLLLVGAHKHIRDREINYRNQVKSDESISNSLFESAYKWNDIDLGRIQICSRDSFYKTRISEKFFERFLETPSILFQMERSLDIRELRLVHQWRFINPNILRIALQNSSFDEKENYQTLETLGDSCLKLMASLKVYLQIPKLSESQMTNQRERIINNEFLSRVSQVSHLHCYMKVFKTRNLKFEIPFFDSSFENESAKHSKPNKGNIKHQNKGKQSGEMFQIISQKIMADGVESCIGAGVLSTQNLMGGFRVISTLKILGIFNFKDYLRHFQAKLAPSREEIIQRFNSNRWKHNMSYADILDHSQLLKQKEIFKSYAQVLKKETNNEFERFEYLGDAVIEIYTLLNAKVILDIFKISHNPENLHNFKPMLLSKFGLTLFSISLDLFKSFDIQNETLEKETQAFKQQLKLLQSKNILELFKRVKSLFQ